MRTDLTNIYRVDHPVQLVYTTHAPSVKLRLRMCGALLPRPHTPCDFQPNEGTFILPLQNAMKKNFFFYFFFGGRGAVL